MAGGGLYSTPMMMSHTGAPERMIISAPCTPSFMQDSAGTGPVKQTFPQLAVVGFCPMELDGGIFQVHGTQPKRLGYYGFSFNIRAAEKVPQAAHQEGEVVGEFFRRLPLPEHLGRTRHLYEARRPQG
jgi:hypothetical protein